jgi:hypothetical protein
VDLLARVAVSAMPLRVRLALALGVLLGRDAVILPLIVDHVPRELRRTIVRRGAGRNHPAGRL